MKIVAVLCLLAGSVAGFHISPLCGPRHARHSAIAMKTATETREQDVRFLVSSVSLFVAKMSGAKPQPPTATDIESYCEHQQTKVDILLAEAAKLRACEDEMECDVEEAGTKVKWTDIDGNAATDAAWLEPTRPKSRKFGF
jgi:hypothetical protein